MRSIDYDYIARNISSLSLIPIRVYKNREQIIFYDPSNFPKDPATPYISTLLEIDEGVNYYISPYEHFFGILKHDGYTMILGPTFQITPPKSQIREFMFSLDLKMNYMEQYQQLLSSITPMPLELFLHELCLIYYYISDKKLGLADVAIYDSHTRITRQNNDKQSSMISEVADPISSSRSTTEKELNSISDIADVHASANDYSNAVTPAHTTYLFEQEMLRCVREGDLDKLRELFKRNSAGRAGKMAPTYLRQLKNIFISSATLLSRAAIEGGLPAEESLNLSDKYIQHAESYNNPEQVMNLQYHMVIDYTTLVNEIRQGDRYDKFMRSVTGYIREHLTEEFSVNQMAQDLFLSRSYLSTKFKKETGMTLSQYIQEQKIEKAKSLLKTTDRSILEIATYLGFSSQGYFQNVFKKLTGMTPKEYRNQ